MSRKYSPDLQAAQCRRLLEHSNPTWDAFHRLWVAFNALYNAVGGPTERERVRSVVQTFITADKALELLPLLVSAENPLPNPPPGDTRWPDSDPRFRRDSMIEAA